MARTGEPFRLHLAQINPSLGDLRRNLDLHLESIETACSEGAQMAVFPELSLTGYGLQDLVTDVALDPAASPLLAPLRQASRKLDIIVGLVEMGSDGLAYNSAVCFREGGVAFIHRKLHLPTYTLFDEGRYFARGDRLRAFSSAFGTTGLLVCEDLWHPPLAWLLSLDGADLILVLSSSPGRGVDSAELASQHAWKLLAESAARFHTLFVVNVSRSGVEDGHTFAGGSQVFGPDGSLLAELPVIDEGAITVELDRRELARCRGLSPLRRDERPDLVQRELGRIFGGRAHDGEPGGQ